MSIITVNSFIKKYAKASFSAIIRMENFCLKLETQEALIVYSLKRAGDKDVSLKSN